MNKKIALLALIIMLGSFSTAGLFSKKDAKETPKAQPAAAAASSGNLAAQVGNEGITMAELDEAAKTDLAPLANQIYTIKKARLDQEIEKRLFELEAKAQGKTSDEIQRMAVSSDMTMSDDAIEVFYDSNQQRFQGKPLEEVKDQIRQMLIQSKMGKARNDFLSDLKKKYPVKVFLEEPRVEVDDGGRPSRGPKNAKVTVIEFSEYQCPFCARFKPTIDQLVAEYPKDVRHVYRHNPLPFHQNAKPAAYASICADRQGKFWEYSSVLFKNQAALDSASLRKYAGDLQLDLAKFDSCLIDPSVAKIVDEDMAYAQSVGARGTPTSFVNGVLFSGAQPYEALKKVVEDKLNS